MVYCGDGVSYIEIVCTEETACIGWKGHSLAKILIESPVSD